MKRRNRSLSSGEIAVMAILTLCLVLAITVTAIRSASRKAQDDGEQFVALEETEEPKEQQASTAEEPRKTQDRFAVKTAEEEMDLIAKEDQETTQLELGEMPVETVAEKTEEPTGVGAHETETEPVQETSGSVSKVQPVEETFDFQAQQHLQWPVAGNVVLDYSMDETIYFPTLQQYRYNPAIVISGEVGTPVKAAADGKVTEVSVNEETGTTVTVDLGGGYTAVYGQLKEVPVKEGSMLSAGDLVGYVSEPTKYYSTEGSNLYFALKKDAAPTDPLVFLE